MFETFYEIMKNNDFLLFNNYLCPLILLGFMFYISYTDIKSRKITNNTLIALTIIRVVLHFIGFKIKLFHILGAIAFFLCFFIVSFMKNHRSGGDIKLAFVLGLYLGLFGSLIVHLVGYLYLFIYFIYQNGFKSFHNTLYTRQMVFKENTGKAPYGVFAMLGYLTYMCVVLILKSKGFC